MPLESCMILLDNSEYMRNGDYIPTRLEAQHDAANMLVGQKTQSNPESTVGVIAMCGGTGYSGGSGNAGAELLVSPTDDMGKILSALHGVPVRGSTTSGYAGDSTPIVNIPASVQVASLALKHRRNKNGAQRVVLFVGSPLSGVNPRDLVKAGRQLKKNNVYIDVVCMGELEENEEKLKGMVDAANGSGGGEDGERTCHLVTIPAGVLPSDVLVTSPIVHGGGAAAAAAAGSPGGAAAAAGGGGDQVDPNMDPELAMALRVSMEEERARQERASREQAEAAPAEGGEGAEESKEEGKEESKAEGMEVDASGTPAEAAAEPPAPAAAAMGGGFGGMGDDEDALLQQALAMSMQEHAATQESGGDEEEKPAAAKEESVEVPMETDAAAAAVGGGGEDEDEAMQMALAMSMQADAEAEPKKSEEDDKKKEGEAKPQQQFQDPQFVNQLLGSLPGVDPNDPAIQSALKGLNKKDGDGKKDGDDKKGDDK
eukprot:CAMPEP_0113573864 /NCGR_PEP_ID=MMETSP0015_2-20120614/26845_1 /TAXON_ID=2838 /ORGANISM="Odontella" /LENGTH=484 /DNA_ID=CAMNT_0000476971 /DNA_START=86 /DNA_END=1541 /DNA_ORIENTATION=+ /assembly_acc=CAM_ASM_000160